MTRTALVPASRLTQDSLRLNGAYYCSAGEDTRRLLQQVSLRMESMRDVSDDIFIGGRARRLYVRSPQHGLQFVSSSDMLLAELTSVALVSHRQKGLAGLILQCGWTLISRSGTIGNVVYANDDLAGKAASEHIMRVVPNDRVKSGYLFAWLASSRGVGLIKQSSFGSVIPTIEPAYVASLPIPRLGEKLETAIHQLVERAATKRTLANENLRRARSRVYEVTGLPRYDCAPVGRNLAGPRTYLIRQSALGTRLEARYHDAFVSELEEQLMSNRRCAWTFLGDCADTFLPNRGKWIDVSVGGIPLVSSGDMFLARPVASRTVSAQRPPAVAQLVVRRNDILVARSGQIYSILGDAVIVGRSLVGKAVTEDAIRIQMKSSGIHPGFLYAFLTLPDYGYGQIVHTAYGTSIPHIPVDQLPTIKVPLPDRKDRDAIGEDVFRAVGLRDDANDLEEEAQRMLGEAIDKHVIGSVER